jgi:hypothetical protein
MRRAIEAAAFAAVALAFLATPSGAETDTAITQQEAHDIGVDAYLYFYPLVIMDITRKQSTNIEPEKESSRLQDHATLAMGPGGRASRSDDRS